jgi:NDP-sugar pyrophosphorylase family protein
MKAMILAAGLGTRLRPLTDDCPKALVEVSGRTLLEIALCRLKTFGVTEVIVNTHHFADLVAGYLHSKKNFGMRIEVSCEEVLLDTGGGLKRAASFFLQTGTNAVDAEAPFLLHNVDVLSNIDLGRMICFHVEQNALATLAVQQRPSSRCLLFDEHGQLCGRKAGRDAEAEWARPAQPVQELAFSGIHVLSPRFLVKMSEEGAFSILAPYLRLAGTGEKIMAFRADGSYWRDLGRPESIAQAAEDMGNGTYPVV